MVLKNRHSIELILRPCRFSVENLSALAGLEGKLGLTWSQHGPDMVPKSRHYIDKGLTPCYVSLVKLNALLGLEVKLG